MNVTLARNIFGSTWMIDAQFAASVLPFILQNHAIADEFVIESKQYMASGSNDASQNEGQNIAVIEMSGALMKNDQMCGPVGMQTIGKWIQAADMNADVSGIILKIDSPGGTAQGTEELSSIIKNTKKPVVALVDGMAASAAYWVASAANTIIMNGDTSLVGSIGTMARIPDMKVALEKAGINIHEIYASASTDKNIDMIKALQGDYSGIQSNMLNPLNKAFTGTVSKNRKGKIDLENENVLTGKHYFAKDAIKYGLADSIGTMDDAIAFIQANQKTTKTQKMTNTRPNLNASLRMTADHQITDGGAFLQEEELNSIEASLASVSDINSKLETAQQTIADLNAANQTLTDASATAQSQIETLTASVADWQAKAEEFGAQRGNDGAAPVAGAEDVQEKEKATQSWAEIGMGELDSIRKSRNSGQ